MALVTTSYEAYSNGLARPWAESELVWPWDRAGTLWIANNQLENKPMGADSWPKTMGEICEISDSGINPVLPLLRAECVEKANSRIASATVDLGAYPVNRRYPLGHPFESFGSGWSSLAIDPEIAHTWTELPPIINTQLRYAVSPHSLVYFRLGLRRDLAAWHDDPYGLNLPLSDQEVDLNEPSLGYFHAENEHFAFTLGRFQVHWSPSPDFGLALSQSVPYHNAAEFRLKMPHGRYRFLVSSLNPWLEGTPLGDSSSSDFPPGSEEYRQRHYADEHQASNAHKRVYADRIKTLFAHRLEANVGPASLGITETEIIGGKVPDLRDGNPFVFFHNDFKDGYTNLALSFDGKVRLPMGLSLLGELLLDDVRYAETEGGNGTPSLVGYLGGLFHTFAVRGWVFTHSIQAIRTDPFLYGYLLPLNTLASRHVLTSNFQGPDKPEIIDKLVVDYPLGYLRGGDALDFWYKLDAFHGRELDLSLTLGMLSQGEMDLHRPYEDYYTSGHDSPSGIAEKEFRARLDGRYRLGRGLEAHAGLGWQSINDLGHVSGQYAEHLEGALGIAWTFPH